MNKTHQERYETSVELAENFSEWAGLCELHRQAIIVLWMGWATRDIGEICQITGFDKLTVENFVNELLSQEIWVENMWMAGEWFDESKEEAVFLGTYNNQITFMLDIMVITKDFDRKREEETHTYKMNDTFSVGDLVQNISGFGPYFTISEIRMSEGQRQIKLLRCLDITCKSTGPWRQESNYKIEKHGGVQ